MKVLIRETNTEDKKCNRVNTNEEVTAVEVEEVWEAMDKALSGCVNHISEFHFLTLRSGSYSTSWCIWTGDVPPGIATSPHNLS